MNIAVRPLSDGLIFFPGQAFKLYLPHNLENRFQNSIIAKGFFSKGCISRNPRSFLDKLNVLS